MIHSRLSHYFGSTALLLIWVASSSSLDSQSTSLSRLLICESLDDACSQTDPRFAITWTFDGTEGIVSSTCGQGCARLTIDRLDDKSIVVNSVEESGPKAGLTAIYTGSIRDNRIGGTVEWSWPGHPGYPTKGVFSGLLPEYQPAALNAVNVSSGSVSAPVMPVELLVCENGGVCNAAWIFKGSSGTGTWFTRTPTRARLAILRFEPDYITIRRTDGTAGVSATYSGSLRGDHWAGTIVWSSPGHPGGATGTWTATVPQTACTAPDLEAQDAMRLGQYALMFKRDRDAVDCYIVAAKAGAATDQAAVGLLYYEGLGAAAQNYKQAFFWLHKAADQGVYAAQRTLAEMYTSGQGTPRDPTLAAIYTARADEEKHDMERRQDLKERAEARSEERAERANRLLSSFVLGASFGIFF
ncbi:MAG: tetratricopeptide repeat protein [Bryobacteraceae bacterium]